jgi:hypothetical protein
VLRGLGSQHAVAQRVICTGCERHQRCGCSGGLSPNELRHPTVLKVYNNKCYRWFKQKTPLARSNCMGLFQYPMHE